MDLKRDTKWLLLLAIVTFAVFANTLSGSFVYDDNRQIVLNPLIQDPTLYGEALTSDVWAFKGDGTVAASNYWRPTFTAWCILNFALFGLDPFGWHLSNVLLHIVAVLLAYALLRQWRLSEKASFAIALLFSIHPVHTESVAWISGSTDILLAAFLIGSFLLTKRWRSSKRTRDLLVAVILYAFALGSKETAIFAIPVYFFIFYLDDGSEEKVDRSVKEALWPASIFAACAAIFFFARYFVLGAITHPVADSTGLVPALKSVPMVAAFYLRQMFLPYEIAENYWLRPVESIGLWNFVVPLVVVSVASSVAFLLARRSYAAALGTALLGSTLLPALNISLFPFEQIVHDRYLYLPVLGFLVLAFEGLTMVAGRLGLRSLTFATTVMILVACLYAYQTFVGNRIWHSGLSLWAHNVKIDADSGATWMQYGSELSQAGRHSEALGAYERAFRNRPSDVVLLGIGREKIALGDLDGAIKTLTLAIETPNEKANAYTLFQSYEALALAYQHSSRLADGEKVLRAAIVRLPIYKASLTEKLAVILYLQGHKSEALSELEQVREQARRELLPTSKLVFFRLGMLYLEQGRRPAAKAAFEEFVRTSEKGGSLLEAERSQAVEMLRKP